MLVTVENFDQYFGGMLTKRGAKGVVYARYDMLGLLHKYRSTYAVNYTQNLGIASKVLFKISYWGKHEELLNLLEPYRSNHVVTHQISYAGEEEPGVYYIVSDTLTIELLSELLIVHFNDDFAIDPSLPIQVQLYIMTASRKLLLNYYDDRGFDQYDIVADEVGSVGSYHN